MSKKGTDFTGEEKNSRAYDFMAPFYDYMLEHVDYPHWYNYIKTIMFVYTGIPDLVLEIGTGTGKFGAKFSRDGFPIVGMDLSFEMLKVAKLRAHNNFSIVCGDVRSLPFKKPFDFIFAVHDTFNYLLTFDDLEKAFNNVHDLLGDNGTFLFDMTTEYNCLSNFNGIVDTFETDECLIHWSNEYFRDTKIILSRMVFESEKGLFEEVHRQRIYEIDEVLPIIKKSGFKLLELYGDYYFSKPTDTSIMRNFILKKR